MFYLHYCKLHLLNPPHNIFIAQQERLDDGVQAPLTRVWNLIPKIRSPGYGIQNPRLHEFPYVGRIVPLTLTCKTQTHRRTTYKKKICVRLQATDVNYFFRYLLHDKFLQFYWLRAGVFQPNLKYLHVKITNLLRVVV